MQKLLFEVLKEVSCWKDYELQRDDFRGMQNCIIRIFNDNVVDINTNTQFRSASCKCGFNLRVEYEFNYCPSCGIKIKWIEE